MGKLQEVYSGFFDLNSICHPYIGYQLFGENYKRSIFLVELKKAIAPRDLKSRRRRSSRPAVDRAALRCAQRAARTSTSC